MLIKMYISKPNDPTMEMKSSVLSLEFAMATEFGGYTKVSDANGAWVNEDTLYMDKVDTYEILITSYDHDHEKKLIEFVKGFGRIYEQQCIPFAVMNSDNHFVEID